MLHQECDAFYDDLIVTHDALYDEALYDDVLHDALYDVFQLLTISLKSQ